MISIVTPVLNGAATIERTLSALARQKADFEHIVQDGGSRDATPDILASFKGRYPISIHREPDKGLYDAIRMGMAKARGDILGWINADDFYMPWTLAVVERVFYENPDIDWIAGIPSWYFEDTGLSVTDSFAPVYLQSGIRKGWYAPPRLGALQQESMFWRRRLWEKVEPDSILSAYRYAADFHLWRRFAEHSPVHTVSTVFACFTISSSQVSGKFRTGYNAECGIESDRLEASRLGRVFHRCISTLAFQKVLKACPVVRDPIR